MSSEALRIVFPFKVLSKPNSYRRGKNSFYTPKSIKEQEKAMHSIVVQSCVDGNWICLTEGCRVTVVFEYKDYRRRDIDNPLKSLFDAMNSVVFKDDSLISELHVLKTLGAVSDSTTVIVEKLVGKNS